MKDIHVRLLIATVLLVAFACICNKVAIWKVQNRTSIIEKAKSQQQSPQSLQQ